MYVSEWGVIISMCVAPQEINVIFQSFYFFIGNSMDDEIIIGVLITCPSSVLSLYRRLRLGARCWDLFCKSLYIYNFFLKKKSFYIQAPK